MIAVKRAIVTRIAMHGEKMRNIWRIPVEIFLLVGGEFAVVMEESEMFWEECGKVNSEVKN